MIHVPDTELAAIIGHAADALECYEDAARWHIERAAARGLEGSRGALALDIAAKRADEVAISLRLLVSDRHEVTAADWIWMEVDFRKISRSRPAVLAAAERDFQAVMRRMSAADLRLLREGTPDTACPELQQLRELECTAAMYAALASVMSIADAIRFTLSGEYDATKARVIAAEEMACLYSNFRKWGF